MSRRINLDSTLSKEEVEYLEARGRYADLGKNAAYHLTPQPKPAEEPESPSEDIESSTVTADQISQNNVAETNLAAAEEESEDEESEDEDAGSSEPTLYDELAVKELKAEIVRRNETRSEDENTVESASHRKADLIAALVEDDTAILNG